ncbi:MAG: ATP-binding cassette domain-containing protein [Brumimicrobium sp.]|nr:ATP-binding cassette domain-containing protein [Brumimicrobium sp.]
MSEKVLQILMQLFAIIALVDDTPDSSTDQNKGRKIVKQFLGQEIGLELVDKYLAVFDSFIETYHEKQDENSKKKKTSVNSVKILRICAEINKELIQIQKIIVITRLIEFANSNQNITELEFEFIKTVAESFNITDTEFKNIYDFVISDEISTKDSEDFLYITTDQKVNWEKSKKIIIEGLEGEIVILQVKSVNAFFLKYLGTDQIILNGQIVPSKRQHMFTPGSSIKTTRSRTIYYSDVVTKFLDNISEEKITFSCNNIVYRFKGHKTALHNIHFEENGGGLIGIMGGSGTGKSTLLSVLNGRLKPTEGSVVINGVDIHQNPKEIEGVIGNISQDDLLIEELTVFENLYFNAQLCFKELSKREITIKVIELLKVLGLYNSKDLKVGNPLSKTISGGQRKRLNIALELIREPSVLFVDEPTSGLSSRDSENIMDLLKELALKGKLIFVVIHQPSSDIFKMFDRLLLLDQGGYPIFYGDPIDSVVYFKTVIAHANCEERYCPVCGNVNPEQIFKIIESKVIDEYGSATDVRKISPKEWNERFLEERKIIEVERYTDKLNKQNKIPGRIKQFIVFLKRDTLSKLSNKQYVLINFLEAPLLAILLGFFVKYFSTTGQLAYSFEDNENLPQFLFMSSIVALFIGLTVASEEIIKDARILERESFLNLSRGSYLMSKLVIMFTISAIQSASFVLIGNFILEIKGMWLEYWLILFSTSCFANLLGLNISATFNSAKVIYILIPLMIIPQLMFSGVIVKFDKLHPWFAKEESVPWIGNIMASRWSYEALAVSQFKDNRYEAPFFDIHQKISEFSWKRDYWLTEIKNQQNIYSLYFNTLEKDKVKVAEDARLILLKELKKERNLYNPTPELKSDECIEALENKTWNDKTNAILTDYLAKLKTIYTRGVNTNFKLQNELIVKIGDSTFQQMKSDYFNESLSDFVTNRRELNKIIIEDDELIQKADPVYKISRDKGFFENHFYAPIKKIFGFYIDTLFANLIVLWGMILLFFITLYINFFRKIMDLFNFYISTLFKD